MWIATVAIHASRSRNLICTNKLKKYGADRRWKHPRKQRLEKCWTHCTRSLSNMRTLYTCIKKTTMDYWFWNFDNRQDMALKNLYILSNLYGLSMKKNTCGIWLKNWKKICITGQRLWIMSSSYGNTQSLYDYP